MDNDENLLAEIKKDRTLIDGLLDVIRDIKNNLKIRLAKSEKAMLDEAERNLVNLLRSESKEQGQARQSVKIDDSGKPFVVIDEDILKGVPKSKWVQTVKDALASRSVLMDKFAVAITSDTKREFTMSKSSQKLARSDKKTYADKFRMVNNIDEIIRNSYGTQNENARHNNFLSFNRSYIDVRIGNNDYSVEVVTGINKTNHEIMYDIVNIQQTQIKRRNTPVGASKSSKNMGDISSNNNISQTADIDNGKKQSGGSGRFSLKIQNVDEHKQKQLDIVQATNPMNDDYHTGIRTVDEYYGPYAQEFRAESCIFYAIYSMPVVFI